MPPLSSEGRVALKEKIAFLTSREQAVQRMGDLSIYELIVLPELLRKETDLNARLLGLANTIVTIVADEAEPTFRDKLKGWMGRSVTSDLVRDLQAYCKARCEAGQPAYCLIARKQYLAGCEITVRANAEGQDGKETAGPGKDMQPKGITALACAPGVYGAASWCLSPLPPAPTWRTFTNSEPDVMKDFEQAMADVFGPKVEASSIAIVKFQTKGDVK